MIRRQGNRKAGDPRRRRTVLLVLLVLSALHYYYWDVQLKIVTLPRLVVFVQPPDRGAVVPPVYQPLYLPTR